MGMLMMKRVCYVLLVVGAVFVGAGAVIFTEALFLKAHAPAGPAQAKGLPGHYYNLVYTLTSCPSVTPEKYDDANITFRYFAFKDSPRMERHHGYSGSEKGPLGETMLKYKQLPTYMAGNVWFDAYKPETRKPAGLDELKLFVKTYAEKTIGPNPEIEYGSVPAAPFSAYFKSGPREGECFTDRHNGLYCFTDQDMAMRRGDIPFVSTLLCSLGIGPYSLDDYSSEGLKKWFERPSREKRAACNFMEIARTIKVKGK
jgi:hypothetical protein